ncbi:MAG: TIGR00366 family protein [Acidimicrobiia bacterium]|nr:TIGR00366 family protein [Acidimicrobiia bacterium]
MSLSWKQIAGWAGVVYTAIFLLLFLLIGTPPGFDDSPAEYREWFVDNETTIAILTVGLTLAFVLILLFASGVRGMLAPVDTANDGLWSRFSYAGAVMMVAMAGAGASFWAVLGLEEVLATASDDTIKVLSIFDTVFFTMLVPFGMAAFVLGASVVILQSGVLAKWVGWLGVAIAALVFIGSLWPFGGDPEGFFGVVGLLAFPPGFLIWTLAMAIPMIRSSSSTASA